MSSGEGGPGASPAAPVSVLVVLTPDGPVAADPGAGLLRADDLGVLRGDGVFERFVVRGGEPRHLHDHLARMVHSAEMVSLELPSLAAWREAVAAGVDAGVAVWSGLEEWEMRLVCTRGREAGGAPTAYVLGQPLTEELLRQRRSGVAVVTLERGMESGIGERAPWLLLGAKTLSYALNMAARRWAQSQGADDAVFVGPDGKIWEAETSAVVAAFGRRLVSPPPSIGILASISVERLFEAARSAGWETERADLGVDDLLASDGVWLSSSLRFARVHTLDGKVLPPAPAPADEELAALAAAS